MTIMTNWQNLYDKIEEGWLMDVPSFIRVSRNMCGRTFMGFVDETGREIIPCKYIRQNKYRFQEGLLEVVNEYEKIGFVNKDGIESIKCQYDEVSEICDSLICVCKEHRWGLISTDGREIIPLQYRFLGHMGHGRLLAQNNNYKVGALDYRGNVVIPFIYYQLGRVTTDNRIEYSKGENGEHGFLDIDGNFIESLPI